MIRIAISGKQRAGKNISADYIQKVLQEKYPNLHLFCLAFADPIVYLEQHSQETLNLPEVKDRLFRTSIGSWARSINPTVFIDYLEQRLSFNEDVIVTDCRFPNELSMLEWNDFYTIRIIANEEIRIQRGADAAFLNDISETGLDSYEDQEMFNEKIINNGSIEELYSQLDVVISHIETLYLTYLQEIG